MSGRLFVESSERYGSKFRTVARINCRKCGVSESIGIQAATGLLPPTAITKKFDQKGWTIGQNEQWDYCPGCTNAMKEKKPVLNNVVKPEIFNAASIAPPREMSRADRQIIIAKLVEVYLDEKRGYAPEWSDHRVSTDLGVPRKWVETLRVENFGDAGTNAEMAEFYEQAKSFAAEARKILAEAKQHYEKAEAIISTAPHVKAVATFSDRLGKLEKMMESVRKYMP